MQSPHGGIAGNDKIGVVAEPLQAAIPNISVDIVIDARGHSKKFNVPESGQYEPNDHNSPGKCWRSEKLTDRQEVYDARKRQRGHEVWPTPVAEVARADRQRHAQRRAECVHSPRGGELRYRYYNSPLPVRVCARRSMKSDDVLCPIEFTI